MHCIAQFQKIKTAAEITAMANHNLRKHLSLADKARIDKPRSCFNEVLANPLDINPNNGADVLKKLQAYWKAENIAIKKDSVLLVDMVLTTSPEYWGDDWHIDAKISPQMKKKIDTWAAIQMAFLEEHFGPEAVKFAVLHLDEKTPHIHIMLSPEETKTLKYKNQYGSRELSKKTLNAKRWGPSYWRKFLDAYAVKNAQFGLDRPIAGSLAEKIPNKEFASRIKQSLGDDYRAIIEVLLDSFTSKLTYFNTKGKVEELFNREITPRLKALVKNNDALKKLTKADRAKEYELLHKLQDEAKRQINEALGLKEHYGTGLKRISDLEKENKLQKAVIIDQANRIRELDSTQHEAARSVNKRVKPSWALNSNQSAN